jgi:hypothetical protein
MINKNTLILENNKPYSMKHLYLLCLLILGLNYSIAQDIPLPEHPRPDFERSDWQNLNGKWGFEFDSLDAGLKNNWSISQKGFTKEINVPFPWGSKLSGLEDLADIGWYKREIEVSAEWKSKRTFLTIGASDWETTVWLDGNLLGKHQGGYTPFSFELTDYLKYGSKQKLVIRVDDARRMFTLYGKQGYGNARGIWQTPYLEARGENFIETIHFEPDIDNSSVTAKLILNNSATKNQSIKIDFLNASQSFTAVFPNGQKEAEFKIDIKDQKLWSLENPHLYGVKVTFQNDEVKSYFGMRKISVTKLPGTDIPYVALNNKPIYLQLALDQSYHPEGFYTFPTDEFMKNEIVLAKELGLNGIRTHIKVDIPRKLYWADKLGLFVMSDLPNSWGDPNSAAQKESEFTLREMIKRDYNHPSIFSWIVFNETWGLKTEVTNQGTGKKERKYLPKTQNWVASMYYLAKSLDQSRLVEDNSICCGAGHTETDINSWHSYLPGYEWEEFMTKLDKNTYPGSTSDFEKGFAQGNQPMINSECGNVWGYKGSTGDIDWSYDYHRMMNVFRQHPKMAGWLYTEHHDVINEWNGYWKFDRSMKFTGLDAFGMKDADFHSKFYVSTGQDITQKVTVKEEVDVPLFISCHTEEALPNNTMILEYQLIGVTEKGETLTFPLTSVNINYLPWMQKQLKPLKLKMPNDNGIFYLQLTLKDENGKELHHNFINFKVEGAPETQNIQLESNAYSEAKWSVKSWEVLDGLKMNGTGKGYFEYEFKGEVSKAKSGYLLFELGAKELFVKDREGVNLTDMDYMLGAIAEPSQNKNSYPMTDETKFSSVINVSINGLKVKNVTLEDDPADHRGVLSWLNQKEDGTLNEAGSYGYLVKIPLTKSQLKTYKKTGSMKVKLATNGEGGLAVYGKDFGRYPFGPSLILE